MIPPLLAIGIVILLPAFALGQSNLFSSDETLYLRIEAPFNDLFAGSKADPDYEVEGTLTDTTSANSGKPVRVTISLRGHTSRRETECTFPKLKVSLADGAGGETLPGGARELKIGTHCGESPELTEKFGRLPNERSPWREAAVYRILAALDVPALRARTARITYLDSGTVRGNGPAQPITRNALLLEDEDDGIARLGGDGEIEADAFTTADAMFSWEDSANLAFAQALIGNFDWCVRFTANDTYRCDARRGLWNVIAAKTGDGTARPVMYDFDVSGMVTGSHRWFANVYNAAFVPSKSPREVEVIGQLQRTRSLFTRAQLDATRRRFIDRRDRAYIAIDESPLDQPGRQQIREYLDAFYREVGSDENFYRPVIVRPQTMLRSEGRPSAPPVCAALGPAPVGTPVSAPVETSENMIKVIVLDALWHWAPPHQCPVVQSGTSWIPANAVGRDYPSR